VTPKISSEPIVAATAASAALKIPALRQERQGRCQKILHFLPEIDTLFVVFCQMTQMA